MQDTSDRSDLSAAANRGMIWCLDCQRWEAPVEHAKCAQPLLDWYDEPPARNVSRFVCCPDCDHEFYPD